MPGGSQGSKWHRLTGAAWWCPVLWKKPHTFSSLTHSRVTTIRLYAFARLPPAELVAPCCNTAGCCRFC